MPLTRKLASKSLIKQNTNQDVIGTGVTNLVRDAFTGTGSQTVFTLSVAPLSAANTQVFISGVYQNKNTYTISGTTLTFSTPPPNATNIEVISGTNYSIGVPGDQAVTLTKLASAVAQALNPVGTVLSYAGSSAPSGYLICNGDVVPNGTGIVQGINADYSALYAILGTSFGAAGKLPDLRGVFVRGSGTNGTMTNANGAAYSATLGATQNDQMQGHWHRQYAVVTNAAITGTGGSLNIGSTGINTTAGPTDSVREAVTDGTNGTPRTGVETRPANVTLNHIIKY